MKTSMVFLSARVGLVFQCLFVIGCFLNAKMTHLQSQSLAITDGVALPSQIDVVEGDQVVIEGSVSTLKYDLSKINFQVVPGSAVEGVNYVSTSGGLNLNVAERTFSFKIQTADVGLGLDSKKFSVRFFEGGESFLGETQVTITSSNNATKIQDLKPIKSADFKYVEMSGFVLYSGFDPDGGFELWRSDNSASGTYRVKDICPGSCSADPTDLVVVSGTAYFVAKESDGGKFVIYKSDGTASGTSKIFNFSDVSIMTGFENSDDIMSNSYCEEASCSENRYLLASSTRLFFSLQNVSVPSADRISWFSTQGTVASTQHLAAMDDTARTTTVFNDHLFVTQEDEVFHWDGSVNNGWVRVNGNAGSLCGGVNDGTFTINNKLYFVCYDVNLSGQRIFKMLSDFSYSGSNVLASFFTFFAFGGGYDYYYYANYDGINYDIYRSDGTAGGTIKVLDATGTDYYFMGHVNNNTIFRIGTGIYQTNGTLAGTSVIKTLTNNNVTIVGNSTGLFFFHNDGRLYKTDGTLAGTVPVVSTDGDEFLWASGLGTIGGELYFSGKTFARGVELWKVTAAGVLQLISERRTGSLHSHPMKVFNFLGSGFVSMVDDYGSVLYKLDTSLNISQSDIKYWAESVVTEQIGTVTEAGGKLFWAQSSADYSSELRSYSADSGIAVHTGITDYYGLYPSGNLKILGTAGESLIFTGYVTGSDHRAALSFNSQTSILSTLVSVVPRDIVKLNSTASILAAKNSTSLSNSNWEPYVTDGSLSGTSLLVDIVGGAGGSNPILLGLLNSKVIFHTNQGFYETNGTPGGTALIVQPSLTIAPSEPISINGKIVFFAGVAGTGKEIWVTDGTAVNTMLLKDTNPTATGGVVKMLGKNASNTLAYFVANDGTNGEELWKTDGTVLGTVMVKDICAGSCNAQIDDMFEFQGKNYFWIKVSNLSTLTASHLWKTDGTGAGTILEKDFLPMFKSGIVKSNSSTLFFTLTDTLAETNKQLWILKPSSNSDFKRYPIVTGTAPTILGIFSDKLLFSDGVSRVQRKSLYLAK